MGACNWTLNTSCCSGWDAYDDTVKTTATDWATGILDSLTGHQYAQCPVTIRPCGPKCSGYGGYLTWPAGWPGQTGSGQPWMMPFVDGGGQWRNCTCGEGGCSCKARCEVPFPGPATVTEVRVDGIVLDSSAYRVDSGHLLIRTDGGCWPDCQDMNVDITEVGTFAVTLSPGLPLPPAGAIAAGELACEFAKACSGDSSCALPQQLQSLTRQGIDVQVMDASAVVADGLTGLANVDLWIRSVNPKSKRQRSRVFSLDVRPVRYV